MIDSHVTTIAEVGSNHGGDLDVARHYVRESATAGADVVKFQTLRRDLLIARRYRTAGRWVDNPVYRSFSNLELPDGWHFELKAEADAAGIEFMSTPFYLEAVDLLEKVGVQRYKIASGDITFLPLLREVARTAKPVFLSTGGSAIEDVKSAVDLLGERGSGPITLLHCVVSYPPAWQEMNLRAVATLKNTFGVSVGISDHSPGSLVPIAATALGGTVVEKHVTFDRTEIGPDHPHAMLFPEFAQMVEQLRVLEKALGSGEKVPSDSECQRQFRFRRRPYDPDTYEFSENGVWLRPAVFVEEIAGGSADTGVDD